MPDWPYSVVAALETGPTSWTALVDTIRLEPGVDVAAATARQVRDIVGRRVDPGQWRVSDPSILIVLDTGYDAARIARLLADLPVEVLGRLRADRVRKPVPVPWIYLPQGGRPPKHGGGFVCGDPATWGEATTVTGTGRRPHKAGTGSTRD